VNLADVMDELAAELDTISGLRVYAFPVDQAHPPLAVIGYPETYTYDLTFGRGVDQLTFPVYLLVSKAWDRSSRDELAPYCDGSGARSIKAVLEGGSYAAMSSVRVASATFEVVSVGSVEFLTAVFSVDVYGSGG
jgi:hypothetical protein